MQENFAGFERIQISNYGVFKGAGELVFETRQTLVVGGSGSGKSTLFNALANLGPETAVRPCCRSDGAAVSVSVHTTGNRESISKFRSLIFIDSEPTGTGSKDWPAEGFSETQRAAIEQKIWDIFLRLTRHKQRNYEKNRSLCTDLMAAGERFCLKLATIFAARKALGVDVTAVFDCPYGYLDMELITGVREFLEQQECQQILILGRHECKTVYPERKALDLEAVFNSQCLKPGV